MPESPTSTIKLSIVESLPVPATVQVFISKQNRYLPLKMLILQAFLEMIYVKVDGMKWSVIHPQNSNSLVLFKNISPLHIFKGLSVQIYEDGSWTVFRDQFKASLPENIPEKLQTIEDATELINTIEKSQPCPESLRINIVLLLDTIFNKL
jgi:hypothetical protein